MWFVYPAHHKATPNMLNPGDPHPDWPETFTPDTAVPIDDPTETNDCMWEDMDITVAERINPPAMVTATPLGPAVHFGPYRMLFNREVTITIPYDSTLANGKTLGAYIYNHLTESWDALEIESAENGLVTFKTMVLGLFQVAEKASENVCPAEALYGESSKETKLLRHFRDEVLSKTPEGQGLIRLYYMWSPVIVQEMGEDEAFKKEMKEMIDGIVPLVDGIIE